MARWNEEHERSMGGRSGRREEERAGEWQADIRVREAGEVAEPEPTWH